MLNRYVFVLRALTPVSHGDTVTGVDNATNTRLFMRQGMLVNGVPVRAPAISENSLRSVAFRQPLADHLLLALGIGKGELPQPVMNLLYSGGNMAAGSTSPTDEFELGHQVKRSYPGLDLLGGAVDSFILPRSRLRLAAWLVAREYATAIAHVAPDLLSEAETVSAFDLLTEETRTRGTGDESAGNQMLYSYETLAAGARIVVEATLDAFTPEPTLGALAQALGEWDGYFGGQARQGRGRMVLEPGTPLPSPGPYRAHLTEHHDQLALGLRDGTLTTRRVLCAR